MKVKVIDAATGEVQEVGPSQGTCMGCKQAPAVGFIFQLCAPCIDSFAAKVDEHYERTGEKYPLSDSEFETMNEPFCKRNE